MPHLGIYNTDALIIVFIFIIYILNKHSIDKMQNEEESYRVLLNMIEILFANLHLSQASS